MNASKKDEYVSIKQAERITGLCQQTIRKLGDQKKVQCYKTPQGGHRRFNKQDLERLCGDVPADSTIPEVAKHNFIYTRVSSKKQLDDLSRQVGYIQQRRPEAYASYTTLSDIGSGINFKRKGLQTILDACLHGTIGDVVVAHRDRLSRFAFDLIQCLVEKAGGKITVLDDERNKSSEQELAEDLLSIVHIYSCRSMGKRSYSAKQKHQHQDGDGDRDTFDSTQDAENQDETIACAAENH
jgi:predicted site-specific integrase-resolvase